MSELSSEMGKRMRTRRKALDLTQDQVAAACHISKSTISRYEKGLIERPHHPTVNAIAKVLQVRPEWLYVTPGQAPAAGGEPQEVREIIAEAKSRLLQQDGLMFDGAPLSAEALQSILDAIDFGMGVAMRRQHGGS